jgi:hypothetical protein
LDPKERSKDNRDFKFGNIKEDLKWIDKNLITKHKDAKTMCWRCRREVYYILECFAKKTWEGVEVTKLTLSATWKRKRDHDTDSSARDKSPKVATIEPGV